MQITETIKQLGLSEKEAAIYSACLENGPLKASDLSSFSGVNRGTVYDTTRALFKKGLLSTTQKRGITHFVANTPRNYLHNLEKNLENAKKQLGNIENLLSSVTHRPKLRFFEGREGIKAIYEDTLTSRSKEILCFSSPKFMLESVGVEFMREFVKRRARRHISMRAINDPKGEVNDNKVGHSTHSDTSLLRQTRIGPESIDIPGMLEIYDNKVSLMSNKKEDFGFIIESEEFSRMMTQFFEHLWASCPSDQEYYKQI